MNLRRSPNDLITLHIYRKEWRLKAQVRPHSEATASAACATVPYYWAINRPILVSGLTYIGPTTKLYRSL